MGLHKKGKEGWKGTGREGGKEENKYQTKFISQQN